ncbi:MAG: C40 family peptidase [Candidatus Onthomonas sp.]
MDRLEQAEVKIPKKTVKRKERAVDPKTGRVTARLYFEETDKPRPPSKLSHVIRDAPALAAASQAHRQIREEEQENVGVEAAHKTEEAAETTVRVAETAHHSHQLKPYRAASQAEAAADKANLNALYQKAARDDPQFSTNPYSRWQQKRAIKKEYAAAKASQGTAGTVKASEITEKAVESAAQTGKRVKAFVGKHKKGFFIFGALLLMVAYLLNVMSSCSVLAQSGVNGIGMSTYPSADEDMLAAEAQYCAMEAELQRMLDTYEDTHSYDEYHFDLDEIGHDPYVLISAITALMGGEWTIDQVGDILELLFENQYILTEEVTTETRHRTETRVDSDGNEYEVDVPYTYSICTVTLENLNLSHVPVYVMSEEQLSMYAVYMSTLGNRPDLFTDSEYISLYINAEYADYDIPPEALEDEQFAAMIAEAEKYLGYPYVWGGSSPATSFDCSGFVSWVINNCGVGWNVGRLGASGLLSICTRVSPANAKPGDLIFFQGTYDTPGASHVGIYVGNSMMIHAGDPIQYTSISSSYWQEHFLAFGRLPAP